MRSSQIETLKTLGIDLWVPRSPLSAAAPSGQWIDQVEPGVGGSSTPESSIETLSTQMPPQPTPQIKSHEPHAERRAMAHIHEALGASESSDNSNKEPETESIPNPSVAEQRRAVAQNRSTSPDHSDEIVSTPVERQSTAPAPRFRLALIRMSNYLFIDALPHQGQLGFSEHHGRLLQGIARCLNADQANLPLPSLVQWPMLAGKSLDQGPKEAFLSVQRQLHWILKEGGVDTLLMMGSGLHTWIVDLESEPIVGLCKHPVLPVNMVQTLSLTEALQMPELKRQIWLDLQPLI